MSQMDIRRSISAGKAMLTLIPQFQQQAQQQLHLLFINDCCDIMGNALTCFERGSWDSHPEVTKPYHPIPEPPQDMTQPLSHYFISSGHNSYLEGNQLTSTAGVRTIQVGLRLGCRVIELDVYDGPNGEPICTHGGTLTSSVRFRDCLKCIAAHGFHTSPYPVILTLENHAGKEQQSSMAAALHSELGNHLFVPTADQLATAGKWLSPEQLKHKVIIRMKVKPGTGAQELESLVYIRNTKIASYDVTTGPSVPSSHSLPETKLPEVPEYEQYGSSKPSAAAMHGAPSSSSKKAKRQKPVATAAAVATEEMISAEQDDTLEAADEARDETAAAAGVATAAAGGAAAVGGAAASINASSKLPASLKSAHLSQVFAYTSKHLLRCYPSGWRMVDNSNPDPTKAWAIGATLAALNWQLWDEPVWTNIAFFSRFGNSGYVLKPSWMTTNIPATGLPQDRTPKTLALTVYSAHKHQGNAIGIAKNDIYVELKVAGLSCDESSVRTEHVRDSGRLVVDKRFEIPISFPEVAVLLVLMMDRDLASSDEVHGYAGIPLATLAPGSYKLPLYEPYECTAHPRNPDDMWVKLKVEWAAS